MSPKYIEIGELRLTSVQCQFTSSRIEWPENQIRGNEDFEEYADISVSIKVQTNYKLDCVNLKHISLLCMYFNCISSVQGFLHVIFTESAPITMRN